ncbi:hypothetical protein BDN72DRAFT_894036 [Pluteus cervinus]|uniref:Uncharacterized protein n=1 Tax=Pluteus cervinus TaxID=181527 RepID=A0ACD3B5V3_9AGAR|nr:hypothetical protein BDN72DRAFT_894036 [Pluteus cervinus]
MSIAHLTMTADIYDFSIEDWYVADPSSDGGKDPLTNPPPSPFPTEQECPLTPFTPALTPVTVIEDCEPKVVSISTAFNLVTHTAEPDLVFYATDGVLFYADTKIIAKNSPDAFKALISATSSPSGDAEYESLGSMKIIPVQESSVILNIILHTVYGTSCAEFAPTFEALVEAVCRMPLYDISPSTHITRNTHLYFALLAYAPLYPLDLYALAGHFKIHDLAVATSSHLLSCSLSSITEEMAERIGTLYLMRLFNLHFTRCTALKDLLLAPPQLHPFTEECSFDDQKCLTRAWAFVSAYLAWDARADLSIHSMNLVFSPLAADLTCSHCKKSLETKTHDVVAQWASLKCTI